MVLVNRLNRGALVSIHDPDSRIRGLIINSVLIIKNYKNPAIYCCRVLIKIEYYIYVHTNNDEDATI